MEFPDTGILKQTLHAHNICVLIPTYNNSGTLEDVLKGVLDYCQDVIVINDGSTDNTEDILSKYQADIDIIELKENKGKGYALKTGFQYALSKGYSHAITIDSDGQHYPSEIPKFAKAIIHNKEAIIIGERDLSIVDINNKSSFANKFSNFWFAVQTCKSLKDTQTGYRAYPLKQLSGLGILTDRYEAELELLVFAAWKGVEIESIPIDVYYPPQSERVSHFRPVKDFTRISVLNTFLCLAAFLYGGPRMLWNILTKKKIFNGEFKTFTRKKGKTRDAALTWGRLAKMLFGFSVFAVSLTFYFSPLTFFMFKIKKVNNSTRDRYHLYLKNAARWLTAGFPEAPVKRVNLANENFKKPALIICNHQSHLDLPVLMGVSDKLIFLTNDWVWHSPVYGNIIHKAEYLPISDGIDKILPQLRDLTARGYSIVVFPEGTRSYDSTILRFHKGAFYIAKQLNLDIIPMVLHGAGYYLPKYDIVFRTGNITLHIFPRISREKLNNDFPELKQQTSYFRQLIKESYNSISESKENSHYFYSLVRYKYVHRGWFVWSEAKNILMRLSNFKDYIDNVPDGIAKVRIINSGIGIFPLFYALVNKGVEVYAYEENENLFQIAINTPHLPANLHYVNPTWISDYHNENNVDCTYIINAHSRQYINNNFSNPVFVNIE